VFDNPAIFQTEDVNAGKAAVTRSEPDQVVGYHEITFGDDSLDLDAHVGALCNQFLCAFGERSRAVGRVGIKGFFDVKRLMASLVVPKAN